MNKRTFYTEYVRHCLRFYARNPFVEFPTTTDKRNWEACQTAFNSFSDDEKELLMYVYESRNTLADNVYELSKTKGIDQERIWELIGMLEREVAKKRGLI